MSEEKQAAGDNADKKDKKHLELVPQVVLPVIVVVLGAVLVAAFTPLGASLRELLFHTRATVTGSVTIDGRPRRKRSPEAGRGGRGKHRHRAAGSC